MSKRSHSVMRQAPARMGTHLPLEARDEEEKAVPLTAEFVKRCRHEFNADPSKLAARNAVASVGSFFATMDAERVNKVSHVFFNTLKRRHLKATNQGSSGRCWMFAGLNIFRHIIIRALNLEEFELSETYLFFWDKLERANVYLNWMEKNPLAETSSREFDYMVNSFLSDGGWWNMFANLVEKYGMVPKASMGETFQSSDSEDMNNLLKEQLDSYANQMRLVALGRTRGSRNHPLTAVQKAKLAEIRERGSTTIYETLVKFLGEPPTKISWTFTNEDNEAACVKNLTPLKFAEMVSPGLSIGDFVALRAVPRPRMLPDTVYRIKNTSNVVGGHDSRVLNLTPDDLAKFAIKSINGGLAVWIAADVRQCFNPIYSTLDDRLDARGLMFKKDESFSKSERIIYHTTRACHAMALTGYNTDSSGRPTTWQVENSWGYWDNETPGLDGFLTMRHSWFCKYVTEVVVHKSMLSRRALHLLAQDEEIVVEPWDSAARVMRVGCVDAPRGYSKMLERRARSLGKFR